MPRATRTVGTSSGATSPIVALIIADLQADDFDPHGEQSNQRVTSKTPKGFGTQRNNANRAARAELIRRGTMPPPGLTLKSRVVEWHDDSKTDATVAYYYGDPSDTTDPKWIGPAIVDAATVDAEQPEAPDA